MTTALPVDTARDRRDDRRVMLFTAGAVLSTFAIGSTLQTVFLFRPERLAPLQLVLEAPMLPTRLATNLGAVAAVLLICGLIRLNERGALARAGWIVATALAVALARHAVQLLLGIYAHWQTDISLVEIGSVAGVIVLAIALALGQVRARVQLRTHERASAEQRLRASAALAELAAEEVRVRREVAEGLHGTLQGRLVMSQTRLDSAIRRLRESDDTAMALDQLATVSAELETIRERDVREFSQLVYPVGVDIGLSHAVRMLVRRIPAEIAVTAEISPDADAAVQGDDPDAVARRIALVRAAEEGITNALRHGAATQVRIQGRLAESAGAELVRVTVDDDGVGLPQSTRWNGLARTAERLGLHDGSVRLHSSELGGACLEVALPM